MRAADRLHTAAALFLLAWATGVPAGELTPIERFRQPPPLATGRVLLPILPMEIMISGGLPAGSTPWQVEIYSTYVYTPEDVEEDDALPDNSNRKLYLSDKENWERIHRCGGVYIGDMWVLTAAHCVLRVTGDVLQARRVRAGTADLTAGGTTYAIERVAVHKSYLGHRFQWLKRHDIALLKIAADAQTSPAVTPTLRAIPILDESKGDAPLGDADPVFVTGWGLTSAHVQGQANFSPDGDLMHASKTLMEASLEIVPRDVCAEVPGFASTVRPGVICAGAGPDDLEADACAGDSGGPLVRKQGARTVLVGLVSAGKGCGQGYPGIYVDVPFYVPWIERAKNAPAGTLTAVE